MAFLVFFFGLIHIWDLPKDLSTAKPNRGPSSVDQQNETANSVPLMSMIGLSTPEIEKIRDVETQEVDCQKITELSVKNLSLRLEGKCAYLLESVVNKTNGYTASVFNGNKSFTTDYISLSSGRNEIEINYKNDKNQEITRQIPIIVSE